MAFYVVERYAPTARTMDDVAGADRHAALSSGAEGRIRHVRTWLLPTDETCFSLFEAPSADAVQAAGDAVGVRYIRITEAIETSGGTTP